MHLKNSTTSVVKNRLGHKNGLLGDITPSAQRPPGLVPYYNLCIIIPDSRRADDECAGNEADERVKLPLSQINELKKLRGAARRRR